MRIENRDMRWSCKRCNFRSSKRLDLIKHYRLKHPHTGQGWSEKAGGHFMHICREIIQTQQSGQIVLFSCLNVIYVVLTQRSNILNTLGFI